MNFIKKAEIQFLIIMLALLSFHLPAAATTGDFAVQNALVRCQLQFYEEAITAQTLPLWQPRQTLFNNSRVNTVLGSSLLETESTNDVDGNVSLNKDYWASYITDSGALCSAPFHWNKSDWKIAGGVLLITAALYKNDTQIMNWVQDNRTDTSNSISEVAKQFGDARVLVPLTVLYVYGCQADDNRARKTAVLSLESFVIGGIFGNSLKYVGHRSRPRTGDPYDTWKGPSFNKEDGMSFPSGHTACAFSVATIVANEYRDQPAIPVISYGIATLTGLSRMNDKAHWASDVFFGAAIGYFTGKSLLERHPDNEKTWAVLPVTNGNNVGLAATYHF